MSAESYTLILTIAVLQMLAEAKKWLVQKSVQHKSGTPATIFREEQQPY